jgi:hypothetical protein
MPEPTLQTTALRYAAGDLSPDEATAFESRLAEDQDARDALAEAVRLSAQAIGQKSPTPHPSFRAAIRERLNFHSNYGHPFMWAGGGAAVVAICTFIGLVLADNTEPENASGILSVSSPSEVIEIPRSAKSPSFDIAPPPHDATTPVLTETASSATCGSELHRSIAEIWADLSNHEKVEKAHDDECRLRQHIRDLNNPTHVSASVRGTTTVDARGP